MEPLLFRNGNLRAHMPYDFNILGRVSMEPLLFRNGNLLFFAGIIYVMYGMFQWSHFFSEMEMILEPTIPPDLIVISVSMEPLLFRNGNRRHILNIRRG